MLLYSKEIYNQFNDDNKCWLLETFHIKYAHMNLF